jgi:hypothetical protein
VIELVNVSFTNSQHLGDADASYYPLSGAVDVLRWRKP